MLMNNLDPDVAERPDDLVVYGGTGKAARSWAAFDTIVRELREHAPGPGPDRFLAPEIEAAVELVKTGRARAAAESACGRLA